jgi:tetratricopeptide (TPR) repeat protein
MMKIFAANILFFLMAGSLCAQSVDEQLQKANTLYKQFKEAEALDAYKQVLTADANNMTALVKCTELSTSIGKKQTDKNSKNNYFTAAKEYADKAVSANSNNADAYYAQSLAFANLSQVETDNKKVVEDVKQIKINADKGLAISRNHALLNYMEGKWHYEMLDLNWFKKAALKTLYGNGLAKPDVDSAVFYMEKCRTLEPYFVQNYLDLAKAYKLKNRPTQEMDVLSKMVKLPNRTPDDAALKEEGRKMLQELQ